MTNVVIFGAPGSGKGTQSEELINRYGFIHISTGDMLRADIMKGTELGKIAKEYIDEGKLVPDETIVGMIEHVIEQHKDTKGIIFDGFPRTVPQAESLCEMLDKHGTEVHLVLDLQVPTETLIERLLNRGKQSGRSDDNLETIQKRLKVYENQTAPLAEYYKKHGKHRAIKGTGTVEEIAQRLFEHIDSLDQ
ncbi:adenylate kinase [Falsiporphyromonas endometrii]|uniref:Adenylate kinase n=1 Tax=Falsiporphyromonas endometrii TaxID=1387297 RepID=A0ABV9K8E6_9PORP